MIRCKNCFEHYDESMGVCQYCGYYEGAEAKEPYYLAPGVIINGRYRIGMAVGAGGFGITYKAWDLKLDTLVAIKEYYPAGVVNRIPGSKEVIIFSGKRKNDFEFGRVRFLDEAKNMAKFASNRNIVHVFDYFEENHTAYIVMEFLEGIGLNVLLHDNGGKMDLESGIRIAVSVAEALKDIHKSGIVHRDISPDNIFICVNNSIKLIDFGAARFSLNEDKKMTVILKPGFAPPEQYESVNEQGPWTDIYALGATLYLLLTGIKPSESTNRKIKDDVVYPHQIDSSIPVNISNAIMKAMALDRHMRFNSVDEFLNALVGNQKVIPVEQEKKKKKTKRFIGIFAAMFTILLCGMFAFNFWMAEKKENTLPTAEITVWIEDNADAELYDTIIKNFESTYDTVTINLEIIPQAEFEDRLKIAIENGEAPDLFQSSSLTEETLEKCADVYPVLNSVDSKLIIDNYDKNCKRIPIGFNVDVAYINTSVVKLEDGNIIAPQAPVASIGNHSSEEYSNFIDKNKISNEFVTEEDFFSEKTGILLSDSTKYLSVQSSLPGRYQILKATNENDNIVAHYSMYFSIYTNDNDKQKVAERLLWYFYGDVAQDIIFVQNIGNGLPLNKSVLETFKTTFSDFENVISIDKKDYEIKEDK